MNTGWFLWLIPKAKPFEFTLVMVTLENPSSSDVIEAIVV
jgi:hypothetical protein